MTQAEAGTMPTRPDFLAGLAASTAVAAAPLKLPFSGRIAVVAQRLHDGAPFVSRNANERFASASVIKLLIAVAVTQKLAHEGVPWEKTLTLQKAQIVPASETFEYAKPGSKATFAALLMAMIAQSDNTAANVLADYVGFEQLNFQAARLGMPETRMGRHFMDFAARKAGHENYTSAADMARIARLIASEPVTYQRTVGAMMSQEDRLMIPAAVKRPVIIANKTGLLNDARHDVAIIGFNSPAPYVLAILTGDFSSIGAAEAGVREAAAEVDTAAVTQA